MKGLQFDLKRIGLKPKVGVHWIPRAKATGLFLGITPSFSWVTRTEAIIGL